MKKIISYAVAFIIGSLFSGGILIAVQASSGNSNTQLLAQIKQLSSQVDQLSSNVDDVSTKLDSVSSTVDDVQTSVDSIKLQVGAP